MLASMVAVSLVRRKSAVAIALIGVIVGATIISGLVSVYYDTNSKMGQELRRYGANFVLTPASPEVEPYVATQQAAEVASRIEKGRLLGYAPYLYGTAHIGSQPVTVAGVNFDEIRRINPYWKITGPPIGAVAEEEKAFIGEVLAGALNLSAGDTIRLVSSETTRSIEVPVRGIVSTGDAEDNQVLIPFATAGYLFDKPGVASVAYFSILNSQDALEELSRDVEATFPEMAATPIKRIAQTEGQVLQKIKSLVFLAVGIILLLTFLCVAITMMNIALARRKEVGLRKALGAHDRQIVIEFLLEGAVIGLIGGSIGAGLGVLFAQVIGQSVFDASISVRPELIPLAVLASACLAGAATFLPARTAARVEPAIALKGE